MHHLQPTCMRAEMLDEMQFQTFNISIRRHSLARPTTLSTNEDHDFNTECT
jgi:hypothetical protein